MEFRAMMIHPNPGSKDFDIKAQLSSYTKSIEPTSHHILSNEKTTEQSLLKAKEKKHFMKSLFNVFSEENNITLDKLFHFSRVFAASKPNLVLKSGRLMVTFEQFCEFSQVERLPKYKELFNSLQLDEQDTIDYRCFLMRLLGFINCEMQDKVDLCFEVFDDDKNGYLDETELKLVLMSNHLIFNEALVIRKLEKLLKNHPTRRLDKIAFQKTVKKFPNIIFPSFV